MVLTNFLKCSTPRRTPRSSAKKSSIKKRIENFDKSNIKVVVRCRPPNEKEVASNHTNIIKFLNDQMLIFDPKQDEEQFYFHGVRQLARDVTKRPNRNLNFLFDRVFNFEATNSDIYEQSINDILDSIMDGYNCSVFAYGATGAGKTFTMLGNEASPGISYLTMVGLFNRMNSHSDRSFKLIITYVEVYNEIVRDLLKPSLQLHLREDRGNVLLSGVSAHVISSAEELIALLNKGNLNRTQHPTDANSQSSRSHAVFQIHMHMKNNTTGVVQQMKLSMIDLAGSERASATSGLGMRFKEGANINKSLLALGNCINSLADGHSHIPYRDSKLTRLLKDSLGGNCKTVMIANISPSSLSSEDTYNTLKYATRAKSIQTVTSSNIVRQKKDLAYYVERVKMLELENEKLKKKIDTSDSNHAVRKQIKFGVPKVVTLSNSIREQFARLICSQESLLQVLRAKRFLEYRSKLHQDISEIVKKIYPEFIKNVETMQLNSANRFHQECSGLESKFNSLVLGHNQNYIKLKESIQRNQTDDVAVENQVLKLNFQAMAIQLKHTLKLLHFERKLFLDTFSTSTRKILEYSNILRTNSLLTSQMEDEVIKSISCYINYSNLASGESDSNFANGNLIRISSLAIEEVPSLNSTITLSDNNEHEDRKQRLTFETLCDECINEICKVNNKLGDKMLDKSDSSMHSDLQNVSHIEQPSTQTTYLIPAKPVRLKLNSQKVITNSQRSQVLTDPSSKSNSAITGKSHIKLFKTPIGTPLQNHKENKENVLRKNTLKTSKSHGTMGTSSRFPTLSNNSSIKTKVTATTQGTVKK